MLIIFSDLDGTLLDFATYDWTPAATAVAEVIRRGIPLVLCSSKTRAEQNFYRAELGIPDPFIVENGSAIFIPRRAFNFAFAYQRQIDGYLVIELGQPAEKIRAALQAIRQRTGLSFRGFSDLSLDEVSAVTGLAAAAAQRACAREYSETIVTPLSAAALATLQTELAADDLTLVSGGKFHTVTSQHSDKGTAVALLTNLYRQKYAHVTTLGLGDSANDRPLLAAVDEAYLLQKPDGRWQDVGDLAVERVTAVGPDGWRQAVLGRLAAETQNGGQMA
mgnify:CR=1 FL=1